MLVTVFVCCLLIQLASSRATGWDAGLVAMGELTGLLAIPGLPWLLGLALDDWLGTVFFATALGWLGTGLLVLLASGAVVQGAANLIGCWRAEEADSAVDDG